MIFKVTLVGAIVAPLIALAVPANASTSTAELGFDCTHTQSSHAPYCGHSRDLSVHSLDYTPGKECFKLEGVLGGSHKVTAQVLGFDRSATRRIKSGIHNKPLCVSFPKDTCPKVNLVQKGSKPLNFGTYPTCGPRVHLPLNNQSYFELCKKNHSAQRKLLQLWHHGKLNPHANRPHAVWIAPGKMGCVSAGFSGHWNQLMQATFRKNNKSPVRPANFLFSAYVWAN